MKAEITKIHPTKTSRNGHSFIRVEFKLDTGKWAKTDLVPTFRNFKRWKPFLDKGIGTFLTGVKLKDNGTVDADSVIQQTFSFEVKEKNDE